MGIKMFEIGLDSIGIHIAKYLDHFWYFSISFIFVFLHTISTQEHGRYQEPLSLELLSDQLDVTEIYKSNAV